MDDSTPPPTSTTTDQRVIELFTQVEAMQEKCTRYEVEMRLMRRMLTQLCPSFPSMPMARSLNAKYVVCHMYQIYACVCMFIKYGNVDCGPMITKNIMLFFHSKHSNIFNNPKSVPCKWNALLNNSLKTIPMRYSTVGNLQICAAIRKLLGLNKDIYWQWKFYPSRWLISYITLLSNIKCVTVCGYLGLKMYIFVHVCMVIGELSRSFCDAK